MITIEVKFFGHVTFGINWSDVKSDVLSTLSLRDFVPSDYSELISWFPDEAAVSLFSGGTAQWPLTIEQLSARVESQEAESFTAILGSETAIGHIEFVRETAERVRLARLVIAPEHRGRGLTAFLLDSASEYARASGFRWMTLLVVPDNLPAMRAYARAGFIGVGASPTRPEYIRMLRKA
jgi:RimJ/RimL family protein N-acetyltransferase